MSNLIKVYGEENLEKLSAAYDAALAAAASDTGVADRGVRIQVLRSLIGMAMRGDFDPERLRETALSGAQPANSHHAGLVGETPADLEVASGG